MTWNEDNKSDCGIYWYMQERQRIVLYRHNTPAAQFPFNCDWQREHAVLMCRAAAEHHKTLRDERQHQKGQPT